mgnify:CR=1 FL=1
MNIERLRFFAGIAALFLVVACAVAALCVVVSGRPFDTLSPALTWTGGIVATLFVYSGLAGKIDAVHRQVNGNLEREVERADNAVAQLTEIARTTTDTTPAQGRHRSNADQNDS